MTIVHRIIRLLCILGAGSAPILSALLCRFVSRLAGKQLLPKSGSEQLPMVTQTWVVDVADGRFHLIAIALSISALVVASGLYLVFSRRPSAEASASALVLVCCVGYSAAILSVGSTLLALVIPFMKMAPA